MQVIIEGFRDILALLEILPDKINNILWHKKALKLEDFSKIKSLINNNILQEINDKKFKDLKKTVHSQGVFAVVDFPDYDLSETLKTAKNIIVLDNVQDPGNVGTIIRTANLIGVDAVVLTKGCARLNNPKLLRSAKSLCFDIPIFENIDVLEFLQFIKKYDYKIFAAHVKGNNLYDNNLKFEKPFCMFFGNEGQGLSQEVLENSKTICIPMNKNEESFNVAVSAAIIMSEVHRQWMLKKD